MTLYLFFVKYKKLNDRVKSKMPYNKAEIEYDDHKCVLYGWTNKKKYRDQFLLERNKSLFIEIRHKLSKNEYNKNKTALEEYKLELRKYKNYNKEVYIISTDFEYKQACSYWHELIEISSFSYLYPELVETFIDEYRHALMMLGLNGLIMLADCSSMPSCFHMDYSEYDEMVFDEDDHYHILIPENRYKKEYKEERDVYIDFDIHGKEINIFVYFFGSLF